MLTQTLTLTQTLILILTLVPTLTPTLTQTLTQNRGKIATSLKKLYFDKKYCNLFKLRNEQIFGSVLGY